LVSADRLPDEVLCAHETIAAALAHRGPDRTGRFSDGTCVLFANQLNITGLDDNQQPVSSEGEEVVSVLNGEIYNYKDLNNHLRSAGHAIRTNCDTETLNKLYLAYDTECFARVHGIFGAALYDRRERRLILARDRFGQIPLFFCSEGGRIHFSSEGNELARFLNKAIDHDSLLQLFSFGFSFDHIIQGVKRLRPGTYLIADESGIRESTFWKPRFHVNYGVTEAETVDNAFAALRSSVRQLAPNEVPYGVFVSGGIDSGTVAKLAEAQCPGLHLFTSGLMDAHLGGVVPVDTDYSPVERTGNELAYADALASSATGEYVCSKYTVADLIGNLWRMIKHLPGGPVMSTSFPPFYFSATGARRSGIRVAFTGEGADELHAGYLTCQPHSYLGDGIAARFVELSNFTTATERAILLGPQSERRLQEMCDALDADVNATFEGDGLADDRRFNRLRFFMLARVFTPHLVEKGNGMTMLGGPTELRMPFLADAYVDVALETPPRYISSHANRKLLLHAVAHRAGVPDLIIDRPKQRTSLPYYHLFYADPLFRAFVATVLNKHSLLRDFVGLEDPGAYVHDLEGTPDAHKRAWLLLILEIWLREMFGTSAEPLTTNDPYVVRRER
jgi:asparagine synthase (glutamine-hydrolysing)